MAVLLQTALSLNSLFQLDCVISKPQPLTAQLSIEGHVSRVTPGGDSQKSLPEFFPRLSALYPPLSSYQFPERSHSAVLSTLVEQSTKVRTETPESSAYLSLANEVLYYLTPDAEPPLWARSGCLPSADCVISCIFDLARESVPGYPLSLIHRNKQEYAVDNIAELYEAVCLRCLSLHYLWDPNDSALQRFRKGQQGFVTVTVKNEAVKIGKPPRLVFPTDLVDEIIERAYRTNLYEVMKARWGEFYSCIGVGFSELDSEILFAGLEPGVRLASNDSPKFDVSRTLHEELLDNELISRCYGCVHPDVLQLMDRHSICSLQSVYVLPDGLVVSQTEPSSMKSGRNATSMGNTMARARRAWAVDGFIRVHHDPSLVSVTLAAGDDCIESHHSDKEETYARLGFVLRDYVVLEPDHLEFCSHDWRPGARPVGQRIAKSLTKLVCGESTDDQVAAFLAAYSNHPDYKVVAGIALASRNRAKLLKFSNTIMPNNRAKQVARKIGNAVKNGTKNVARAAINEAKKEIRKELSKGAMGIAKDVARAGLIVGSGDYVTNSLVKGNTKAAPSFGRT